MFQAKQAPFFIMVSFPKCSVRPLGGFNFRRCAIFKIVSKKRSMKVSVEPFVTVFAVERQFPISEVVYESITVSALDGRIVMYM